MTLVPARDSSSLLRDALNRVDLPAAGRMRANVDIDLLWSPGPLCEVHARAGVDLLRRQRLALELLPGRRKQRRDLQRHRGLAILLRHFYSGFAQPSRGS